MTAGNPLEAVTTTLVKAGYHQIPPPQRVVGINYEFAAMLVATKRSQDIVVIIDSLQDDGSRAQQQVEAFARRLDLIRSTRPLTVVAVGPPLRPAAGEAISRVARLLVVGVPKQHFDRQVADALAVLLPLPVDATQPNIDPLSELQGRLSSDLLSRPYSALIEAASRGADAVTSALAELLTEPLGEEDAD